MKKWFSSGGDKVTEIVGVMVNLLEDRRKTQLTREIGYIKVKCDMDKGLGLGLLDGNISLGNWQSAASHCLKILVEFISKLQKGRCFS